MKEATLWSRNRDLTEVKADLPYLMLFPCVTCHLSLMLIATATDPLPANSPDMQSRPVCKDPKTKEEEKIYILLQQKKKNNYRYSSNSDTLFIQKSPVHREAGYPRWECPAIVPKWPLMGIFEAKMCVYLNCNHHLYSVTSETKLWHSQKSSTNINYTEIPFFCYTFQCKISKKSCLC